MTKTAVTWTELTLFDPGPPVVGDAPPAGEEFLSAQQRLTRRNRTMLGRGLHPATRLPLLVGPMVAGTAQAGPACGSCAHHLDQAHNGRHYHKCNLCLITAGAASDIRTSWPACTRYEVEA